jgi:hypothetical protein
MPNSPPHIPEITSPKPSETSPKTQINPPSPHKRKYHLIEEEIPKSKKTKYTNLDTENTYLDPEETILILQPQCARYLRKERKKKKNLVETTKPVPRILKSHGHSSAAVFAKISLPISEEGLVKPPQIP